VLIKNLVAGMSYSREQRVSLPDVVALTADAEGNVWLCFFFFLFSEKKGVQGFLPLVTASVAVLQEWHVFVSLKSRLRHLAPGCSWFSCDIGLPVAVVDATACHN
jgi:hypothetical protein